MEKSLRIDKQTVQDLGTNDGPIYGICSIDLLVLASYCSDVGILPDIMFAGDII